MKVRNMTIKIQSLAESAAEFVKAVHAIEQGKTPSGPKDAINFESLEAMRQVLTPKRLELLKLIRENRPNSIYELAKAADRDLKNVQDDVGLLSRIGLVTLSRPREARKRVVPRVEYDRLQVQIPVV